MVGRKSPVSAKEEVMHRSIVVSPLFRCALGIVLLTLFGAASSASVIYEYREAGSTSVIGTLEIMTPPADAGSGWSTTDSSHVLALFLDDAEFGLGSDDVLLAINGISVDISSLDGSKLDSGAIQLSFPTIVPSDPAEPTIDRSMAVAFDLPAGGDFIGLATQSTFPDGQLIIADLELNGDWTLAENAAVPEPGTLALLGIGLLVAGQSVRRRRRTVRPPR
jgi:hypothetical protein